MKQKQERPQFINFTSCLFAFLDYKELARRILAFKTFLNIAPLRNCADIMPNKLFCALVVPLIISVGIAGLVSLFLYLTHRRTGEFIEGTGFIEREAPILRSNNFDVDSEGNFYFCSDENRLIQISNSESKFKYSIPLPKNPESRGTCWIEVNEDDTVDYIFDGSHITIWHYDKNGFLIGEEIPDSNTDLKYPNNGYVLKDGIRYINPNAGTWYYDVIYKDCDGIRSVAFAAPLWQKCFNIWFTIFFWSGFALIAITFLDLNYMKSHIDKDFKDNGEDKKV